MAPGLELGLEGGVEVAGLRMMTQSEGSGELCRPEQGEGGVLLSTASDTYYSFPPFAPI